MWDAIFIVNSVPNKVEIPIKRWIRYHVLQEKQGREVKLAMKTILKVFFVGTLVRGIGSDEGERSGRRG